jgi:hypothetical protein
MPVRNQFEANAVTCAALVFVFAFCTAIATAQNPLGLPVSPKSGSLLVAEAIHSGAIQLPLSQEMSLIEPALTCSPVPCVLPNVQASGGTNIANEDPIAANPKNAKQLLTGANDYSCSATLQGFYNSTDGGSTWTHTCLPAISGGSGDGDPMVGYDLLGNAFAGGIQIGPPGQVIVVAISTNNGTTWSTPVVASKPTISGGITDKGWLQIDTTASSPHANCLYLSNTQFDSTETKTQISVSHSCDHGQTWKTVTVDPVQSSVIDQFSDLAIGKDGAVYVSWQRCSPTGPTSDCGGTTAKMFASKSTDGGTTWSTPVTIVSANLAPDTCGAYYGCLPNTFERVSNIPVIAIDNSTGANAGHLYVIYYNWTGTQLKVYVTHSTNGGATWSAGVPVAPASATHDQFFAWLNVAANGDIGATWLDRRNDPNNLLYDSYLGGSANGGASFPLNAKLTSVMSNPNDDGFGGGFMGDYTGNTIAGSTLYASWMDMRNGSFSQDYVGGYKVH